MPDISAPQVEDAKVDKDEPIDFEKLKNKKRRKVSLETMNQQNYYELLNLSDDPQSITIDAIKRSYKRLAVMYHPDKQEGAYTEKSKQEWLKV